MSFQISSGQVKFPFWQYKHSDPSIPQKTLQNVLSHMQVCANLSLFLNQSQSSKKLLYPTISKKERVYIIEQAYIIIRAHLDKLIGLLLISFFRL